MIEQPTRATPPQFRATLANVGETTVTLEYGAGLLWSVDIEYPDELLLRAIDPVIEAPPDTPGDACWERSDLVPIPAIAIVNRSFAPGDRLTQRFAVYDDAEDGCYPAGEYEVRDVIEIDDAPVEVVLTIRIDASRTFAVEAGPSTISGAARRTASG